jgi:hypothetical protein
MGDLIGVGVYTPAEASRLINVPAGKIARWLRGHSANGRDYAPLWQPEVDLEDGRIFLGFRDLMEVRVAAAFIKLGLSSVRVRSAILLAREALGQDHPLSTNRFRTDGRDVFVSVVERDETGREKERLLNLFKSQFEFRGIIDPILRTVDFDDDQPQKWWPRGRGARIVLDPARSFGQPIEASSSVPTAVLAAAARQDGVALTARAFAVTDGAVRRAVEFEDGLALSAAA